MMNEREYCAICRRRVVRPAKTRPLSVSTRVIVECVQCGRYEIGFDDGIATKLELPELAGPLSCATRQSWEAGQSILVTGSNAMGLAAQHRGTRVSDNIERLLAVVAKKAGRPNGSAFLNPDDDFTLIDCLSKKEFNWYIRWITDEGFVSHEGNGPSIEFKLTVPGWTRIQPASRPGGIPGRCFVAMSFDKSMDEIFDLGISPAVVDCQLPRPLRIDRKEHNNQITDEMIAEIRDAQFVVADFTGHRAGVYYEAGFARGLGRPVIHCCRDTDIDNVHFDTKIINHITWSDAADLRTKLANRIKATIIPSG